MAVPESPGCFVCEKHRIGDRAEGGVLLEDRLMYVGHVHTLAGPTAYRGHLVVEPRRHVAAIGDLDDAEASALGRTCNRVARVLMDAAGAEHVYMYTVGDEVSHLHVHLVPRYPGTPREHWGPGVTRWTDAPRVDPRTMRAFVSDLRHRIEPD
jgi:diadenosine tetraphosphate (Ap4A) HIT family hydrolase